MTEQNCHQPKPCLQAMPSPPTWTLARLKALLSRYGSLATLLPKAGALCHCSQADSAPPACMHCMYMAVHADQTAAKHQRLYICINGHT